MWTFNGHEGKMFIVKIHFVLRFWAIQLLLKSQKLRFCGWGAAPDPIKAHSTALTTYCSLYDEILFMPLLLHSVAPGGWHFQGVAPGVIIHRYATGAMWSNYSDAGMSCNSRLCSVNSCIFSIYVLYNLYFFFLNACVAREFRASPLESCINWGDCSFSPTTTLQYWFWCTGNSPNLDQNRIELLAAAKHELLDSMSVKHMSTRRQ